MHNINSGDVRFESAKSLVDCGQFGAWRSRSFGIGVLFRANRMVHAVGGVRLRHRVQRWVHGYFVGQAPGLGPQFVRFEFADIRDCRRVVYFALVWAVRRFFQFGTVETFNSFHGRVGVCRVHRLAVFECRNFTVARVFVHIGGD